MIRQLAGRSGCLSNHVAKVEDSPRAVGFATRGWIPAIASGRLSESIECFLTRLFKVPGKFARTSPMRERTMMSTAHPGEPPPDDEVLQFDEAEFSAEPPAAKMPTCASCQQPIPDAYFEVAGKVVCGDCRERIEAAYRSGSGLVRFMKASVFGLGAAFAGGLIYYITVRVTGLNIGLIAILVGIIVGQAVRSGSGNRGGLAYQFLAVFLTYSAIVAMNAPLVIEELMKVDPAELEAADPAPPMKDAGKAVAPAKAAAPAAPAQAPPQAAEPVGPLAILAFLGGLIVFFYKVPFYEVMSAPISGVIYAFGLWQAWRLTMPGQFVINGPFKVGERGSLAPGGGHVA